MTRPQIRTLLPARTLGVVAAAACATLLLGACGSGSDPTAAAGSDRSGDTVTVDNCDTEVSFPAPAQRMFVNDGNMVAMALALGAEDQVGAVSGMARDLDVLSEYYGEDAVAGLNQVSDEYPSNETVIAARPDVVVAGWNYGYDEAKGLTPAALAERDIAAYTLTESCRQRDGERARGIVDPWTALRTDLGNLGEITGQQARAEELVADLDSRLSSLEQAPGEDPPVVFVFDSGEKAVFTSGSFGAPQAIIEAGGGTNAMSDLEDTWTEVSWERLAASRPDAFVFVDYPGQTYEQKLAVLRANPATRDLPAVTEERFLNLPYAMWTSSPLNIDAAEQVRGFLEEQDLVPAS